MNTTELVAAIDEEIANLQQARAVLGGGSPIAKTRGAGAAKRKKRTLSPEARARIAAAQRKRWATQKKAAKS